MEKMVLHMMKPFRFSAHLQLPGGCWTLSIKVLHMEPKPLQAWDHGNAAGPPEDIPQ